MKVACHLANRESIRAFYSEGILLIVASGEVSAGDRVDIQMDPSSTVPAEFRLLACPRPGAWPRVMRPYRHREIFVLTRHPERVRIGGTIRVHHQEGVDDVALEAFPHDLRPLARGRDGQREATGYSPNLSFDEAFAEAVKILTAEPAHPDELLHVRVDEVGGLFGGFAGFHELYVRVTTVSRTGGGPIEEIAPERPGRIVEVGPERPEPGGQAEVIVEVAPGRMPQPEGEVIVEVGPERPGQSSRQAEVITEVAPQRVPRRDEDVVVEVAPERPEQARRQGPIAEVAPDRPESS